TGQNAWRLVEGHHVAAPKTFMGVPRACPAYIRVGVSVTPFKMDDARQIQNLRGVLGDPLFVADAVELINRGLVTPVKVSYLTVEEPKTVCYKGRTYRSYDLPYEPEGTGHMPGAYNELIVNNT